MDRELERYIITGLVLILLVLGISGCGAKNIPVKEPQEEISQPTVSNLEGIAFVLGCMFDPTPCQAKKDLGKTEEGK